MVPFISLLIGGNEGWGMGDGGWGMGDGGWGMGDGLGGARIRFKLITRLEFTDLECKIRIGKFIGVFQRLEMRLGMKL